MVYNFSERKDLNERVEKELFRMKEEYQRQGMSGSQLEKLLRRMEESGKAEQRERNRKRAAGAAVMAAAFMGIFVLLPNTSASIAHAMEQIPVIGQLVEAVTFRNYSYETERNMADIEVPEIKVTGQEGNEEIQEKLNRTVEDINAEITEISDRLIAEFEDNLKGEEGYQDVVVKGEVLVSTQDYFTLKLFCYQGAGSGYQWNYYYTIDLKTGERLELKELFREGADYITVISENIKQQMQAQMDADEMVVYWLDHDINDRDRKSVV